MTTNSANIVNNKSRIFAFWIVRLTLGISFFFHGWGKKNSVTTRKINAMV